MKEYMSPISLESSLNISKSRTRTLIDTTWKLPNAQKILYIIISSTFVYTDYCKLILTKNKVLILIHF